MRVRHYSFFCLFAALTFLIGTIVSRSVAEWATGQNDLIGALGAVSFGLFTEPVFTLILLVPYALVGLMAGSLANQRSLKAGAILFAAGALLILMLYFWGFVVSALALQEHAWTASALSIGLLPFLSLPLLGLIGIARLLAGRKSSGD